VLADRVLWQAPGSQLENLRDYFTCFLTTIPILLAGWFVDPLFSLMIVLPAGGIFWRSVLAACKRYELTESHLRIHDGLFRRVCLSLPLSTIVEMTVKTPVLQQWFGRGTLRVRGTDEKQSGMTLFAISDPENVKAMIWRQVEKRSQEAEADHPA